jgi:23S rRNA-/tRNA-specific pseudouridylate synthase
MNYEEKEYSLLELSPKTGRTHQIRIHLKFIGHPIAADEFYAGRKTARSDREWCPRLFLHAATISFIHPVTGKLVSYKSDLPDDLKSVLDSQLQSN